MKKTLVLLILTLFTSFCFLPQQNLYANVFASQIKLTNPDGSDFDGNFSDETLARISFFLNDTANVVTVLVKDVETDNIVAQIDGGAMSEGPNSVDWNGIGAESNKKYIIEVTAQQPNHSNTDWTMFYDSGDIEIFTRGVAVVTDQKDQNFGLIFTANDGGSLGTGINIFYPDGTFHDPFLVAPDKFNGGTFDYGTDAPLFAAMDSVGRLYVSLKDLGKIVRINRDFSIDVIIEGLSFPKGIYLEGKENDFSIYVAADRQILRGTIGTADNLNVNSMEVVAQFTGFYPHQVILDDEGFLYTTLRTSNDLGSDGEGIRKYNLAGTLPVTDNDAEWFLEEDKTFIANDLLFDYGDDRTTNTDDILYFCTRAGDGNDQDGIWRINDINAVLSVDVVRIITEQAFYGADDNVQARATMDFDAAGNIIFMENANEHVFFFAPPMEGETNSFTTTGPDTILIVVATAVEENSLNNVPNNFELHQNYPNPFNPSTTITFSLNNSDKISLEIYNLNGKLIKSLAKDIGFSSGVHAFDWDGTNQYGEKVPSGQYIYTIRSKNLKESRKMILLK